MGVTRKATDAYQAIRKAKKARKYYKIAKDALDEDTRSGALFEGGIKITIDVVKKQLGANLTWHPYYTFHKVHLDALKQALNASAVHTMAMDALTRAVAAADSTASVKSVIESFTLRQQQLIATWYLQLAGALALQAEHRAHSATAAAQIREAGYTPESLDRQVGEDLLAWRAGWAELCQDAIELHLMVEAEVRVAEQAFARYNAKVRALTEGSSPIGRIAGYAAERDRQWMLLDRATGPQQSSKPLQAVEDPARFARIQRDVVELFANRVVDACDIALSDAVSQPEGVLPQLMNALNGR